METLASLPHPDPALLWLFGETLRTADRPRAAADVYRQLVEREPRSVSFRVALAEALAAADVLGEAIEVARAAVALAPRDIRARLILVDALSEADLYPEALSVAEEARAIAPEDAQTSLRLARVRLALGHVDDAGRAFERVLVLSPRLLEARIGLGRVALERGRLQRAIELLGEALTETPDDHRLRLDLCLALRRADLFEEARRLLSPEVVGPAAPDILRIEAARLALAAGDWPKAAADFDRRPLPTFSDRPRWNGRRAPAERLVVVAEEGECDTLAFGRLLPALSSEVMSVTLAVPASRLAALRELGSLFGDIQLVDSAELPPHDMCLPLASLPLALGIDPRLGPSELPPPPKSASGHAGVPTIGLALGPSPFSPIVEPAPADIVALLRGAFPIARLVALDKEAGRLLSSRVDTDPRAVMAGLDLVVATDGPVAHLAGGLGRPLWLLLDCAAHWMWGREGRLSGWYPSARLFRAKGPNWHGVAEALHAEVVALTASGLSDLASLRRLADAAGIVGGDAAARTALPYASRLAALVPSDSSVWVQFVSLLLRLGEEADADRALVAALVAAPRHAPLLLIAARRENERGEPAAALRHAEQALGYEPGSVEALMTRATALLALGEPAKAEFALRQAVLKAPRRADLLVAWGETLRCLGDSRSASRAFERAMIAGDSADARLGLGRLALAAGESWLALHLLGRAVALDPGHVEAALELARALRLARRTPEATTVLQRLVALRPGAASAHAMLGELLLSLGDFAAGAAEFEWRHGQPPRPLPPVEDVIGRAVVLTAEGGDGALMRLVRYAPLLRAAGAVSVRVSGAPALDGLLGAIADVDGAGEPQPGDLVLPILSLPAFFGTTIADLPAPRRYIRPDAEAVTAAAMRIADLKGVRIGVALAGIEAGIDFSSFADIALVALDAEACARLPDVAMPACETFADIAALAVNLDAVVVSAASPIAALAAALGRPVFVIGPEVDDWLWLEHDDRSPWFPTARLFPRAPGEDDASGQTARLLAALTAFTAGDRSIPFASAPSATPDADTAAAGAENASALVEAASVALDRRDDHRAILLLSDAIAAGAGDLDIREKLAGALMRIGEREKAGAIISALVAAAPTAERLSDLSEIDRLGGRLDDALVHAERAVALRPDLPFGHRAVGKALLALGRIDKAIAALSEAVGLAPTDPELLLDEAEALLVAGDYRRGFARFEVRWQAAEFLPRRFDVPRWSGEDIGGRTLLVHGEQALGAQIAFARFLPELTRRGARLVIEVRPALVELFRSLDLGGDVNVVEQGRRLPPHDLEVPLLSLPHVLSVERGALPAPARLLPDPLRVDAWRRLIGEDGLKVGLYWHDITDAARFAGLSGIKGVRCFALDRRGGRASLGDLPAGAAVTPLGERLFGFAETASAISALDLVIAPASATAHLAASLGRPTLVIDPSPSDWFWSGTAGSPWYPEATVLRASAGDIAARLKTAVIERLAR
jgi:tetratricopeptide (TPR) repeat protein